MPIRDALSPLPDRTTARRLAFAIGVTTGGIAIAAVAVFTLDVASARTPSRTRDMRAREVDVGRSAPPARDRVAPWVTPRSWTPRTSVASEEIALALREVKTYAFEVYPAWSAASPAHECPDRLLDLNRYAPALHAVDPWGGAYRFLCGAQYGVRGIRVSSAGPDLVFDTADDLTSDR